MSYPLSDDDSTDSDSGIRFKTANTRDKLASDSADDKSKATRSDRDRYASRRDEKHSSSGHHSHRSHRARSSDRSRGRRDRSRSQGYRKRSPESLSSGRRNEGERRRSEKSSRSSNREYDRSRSRGNSPDRAYSDKVSGTHYDDHGTKNTRSDYRSMSDDEGTRRETHHSHSDGSGSEKDPAGSTSPYIEYLEYLDTAAEATPSAQCSRRSSEERTRRPVKCPGKAQVQGPVSPSYIEYLERMATAPKASSKLEKRPKADDTGAPAADRESEENRTAFGPALPAPAADDQYGPVLPQPLQTQRDPEHGSDIDDIVIIFPTAQRPNANDTNGVVLVAATFEKDEYVIGPALPPHLQTAKSSSASREPAAGGGDGDVKAMGPMLSSRMVSEASEGTSTCVPAKLHVIGPVLPPNLRATLLERAEEAAEFTLPDDQQTESDDEDVIGPLPAGCAGRNRAHTELEERALQLKLARLEQSKDDRTVREEWMLELPQVQAANLGLGPRQFRAKGVPDMSDRSAWTDTPQDKAKKKVEPPKVDIKREAELRMIRERDVEQQCLVEKHKKKKKRDKSLLAAHQEEYNRKRKKDLASGIHERRPFDRDIDLKANRFDEAQKKAILKKAQLLDNRFSSGESKFL